LTTTLNEKIFTKTNLKVKMIFLILKNHIQINALKKQKMRIPLAVGQGSNMPPLAYLKIINMTPATTQLFLKVDLIGGV